MARPIKRIDPERRAECIEVALQYIDGYWLQHHEQEILGFIEHGNWLDFAWRTDSERRAGLLMALWPLMQARDKPRILAEAISSGDLIHRYRDELLLAMDELRGRGQRAFDGVKARRMFEALPDTVTVYRGACMQEALDGPLGICWTLDRERAIWFATEHGRFRNLDSEPCLLAAEIVRENIVGVFAGRNESEVALDPEHLINEPFITECDPAN